MPRAVSHMGSSASLVYVNIYYGQTIYSIHKRSILFTTPSTSHVLGAGRTKTFFHTGTTPSTHVYQRRPGVAWSLMWKGCETVKKAGKDMRLALR